MAFNHGKTANFYIDGSSGGLIDISAYMDSIDFPQTADTAEVTAFGASNKSYVAGLKDATISIEGPHDSTIDGIIANILGTTTHGGSFQYYPNSTASGSMLKTGECICTAYNPPRNLGSAGRYTASFQVTGSVTSTTVA